MKDISVREAPRKAMPTRVSDSEIQILPNLISELNIEFHTYTVSSLFYITEHNTQATVKQLENIPRRSERDA